MKKVRFNEVVLEYNKKQEFNYIKFEEDLEEESDEGMIYLNRDYDIIEYINNLIKQYELCKCYVFDGSNSYRSILKWISKDDNKYSLKINENLILEDIKIGMTTREILEFLIKNKFSITLEIQNICEAIITKHSIFYITNFYYKNFESAKDLDTINGIFTRQLLLDGKEIKDYTLEELEKKFGKCVNIYDEEITYYKFQNLKYVTFIVGSSQDEKENVIEEAILCKEDKYIPYRWELETQINYINS